MVSSHRPLTKGIYGQGCLFPLCFYVFSYKTKFLWVIIDNKLKDG